MAEETPPGAPPAETPPATPPPVTPPPGILQPPATPPPAGADWLPEDLRESEGLKKFHEGGIKSLATSYLNLEKAFQGKIPGEGATPEEVKAFYGPMGVPDTAEGYTIKKPDNLPEGVEWNEDNVKTAAAVAHKKHLSNDQFQGMIDFDTQRTIDALADNEAQSKQVVADNIATLKKNWGGAYDEKVSAASLTAKTFAPEALWDKMEKQGLTSDPIFIELMEQVSKGLKEGRRIGGLPSADLTLTPEEADREQKAIATDKKHPLHEAYHDRKHGDHKTAIDEVSRLGQLKRGKKPE